MFEMIESRRSAEKKEERSDLFSSLMDAADEDSLGSPNKLTDREIVGNTFIFRECSARHRHRAGSRGHVADQSRVALVAVLFPLTAMLVPCLTRIQS